MTDTQSIENPTPWSDYDFLEFEGFVSKVGIEGYSYAVENYGPSFEDPKLRELADDEGQLRALYRQYRPKADAWAESVGWERAGDLHNDHVDEVRQRAEDACLFGVRCADGDVITAADREGRDSWVALLRENEGKSRRVPEMLLSRTVPGGEWTEERRA